MPLFFGDHDFLPDGSALLCTMGGDVWRVEGLDDESLKGVRWRRVASGLHQALGLLGEKAVRHWVSAAALTNLAREKPNELVIQSMLRARFCDALR